MSTTIFPLIRLALGTSAEVIDFSALSEADWKSLVDLSFEQGVASLAVDGLGVMVQNCPEIELDLDKEPLEDIKYEWFGACFEDERSSAEHLAAIGKLASIYNSQAIRMLVIKGYGLSLNYPLPNHRSSGDIDIYLYGDGERGDQLAQKYFGCEVKQNEDKHSIFQMDGVSVENHACFVNDKVYPSYKGFNDFLMKEAENGQIHQVGAAQILLPSAMFNALFVPLHCASHFFRGETSIRQLCDWACFVMKYSSEIDWDVVRDMAMKYGFWSFYCCLNGIVQDYLGVPSDCLPDWPRDKKLECKVMEDILKPRKRNLSLLGKVYRFFSSRWKYKMVYRDNMLVASVRQAKAYLRWKNQDAVSIWKLEG